MKVTFRYIILSTGYDEPFNMLSFRQMLTVYPGTFIAEVKLFPGGMFVAINLPMPDTL